MVGRLRHLIQEIHRNAQSEQERLETLVALRTSELFARNRDLRLVMDNVEQGFMTIDAAGTMSDERSLAVERWFGTIAAGATLWDTIDRVAPGFGTRLRLGWDQVLDGFCHSSSHWIRSRNALKRPVVTMPWRFDRSCARKAASIARSSSLPT